MAGIPKKVHKSVLDDLNLKLGEIIDLKKKVEATDHVNRNLQAIITKKEKQLKTETNMYQNASNERDVLQGTNKKYRSKIGRLEEAIGGLEEKLKQNEEAYFELHGKVGRKSEKEWQDKTAKLRKKIAQLQEGNLGVVVPAGREIQLGDKVAELEHSLGVAKTVHDQRTEREKDLKSKLQQAVNVKDLYEDQLNALRAESAKDREENRCEIERLIGEIRGANFCFQKLVQEIFGQKGGVE